MRHIASVGQGIQRNLHSELFSGNSVEQCRQDSRLNPLSLLFLSALICMHVRVHTCMDHVPAILTALASSLFHFHWPPEPLATESIKRAGLRCLTPQRFNGLFLMASLWVGVWAYVGQWVSGSSRPSWSFSEVTNPSVVLGLKWEEANVKWNLLFFINLHLN